jgi:hypothetical protein
MQRKEMSLEKEQALDKIAFISIVLICLLTVIQSYIVYELFEIRKGIVASQKFSKKEIDNHERVEELLLFDESEKNSKDIDDKFYAEMTDQLLASQARAISKLGEIARINSYLILALAILLGFLNQIHLIIRIATIAGVIYFLYFKGIFVLI